LVTGNKKDFPKEHLGFTRVAGAAELLNPIILEL
jgi:hypothetical protein